MKRKNNFLQIKAIADSRLKILNPMKTVYKQLKLLIPTKNKKIQCFNNLNQKVKVCRIFLQMTV